MRFNERQVPESHAPADSPDAPDAPTRWDAGEADGEDTGQAAWGRGAGPAALRALALAHAAAGLIGAVACLLTWYLAATPDLRPALLAGAGAVVALGAALALELGRSSDAAAQLAGRALLPVLDLVAAIAVCWLLAPGQGPYLALLLVPATVAALLLGWPAGAAAWLAGLAAVPGIAVAYRVLDGGTTAVDATWWTPTLALGLAGGSLVAGAAAYAARSGALEHAARRRTGALARALDQQHAERERLMESLEVLQEMHVQLERERGALDRQVRQLSHVVRCLADGDLPGARGLLRAVGNVERLVPPLRDLAVGVERMTRIVETVAPLQHRSALQQRSAEYLVGFVGQQVALLDATDRATRDQGAIANQLAAELQIVARGTGSAPGERVFDREALLQALHSLELLALGHASGTAMLGARLAQLRARHEEMELQTRRMAGMASGHGASDPLRAGSGIFRLQHGAQNGVPHDAPRGAQSGVHAEGVASGPHRLPRQENRASGPNAAVGPA